MDDQNHNTLLRFSCGLDVLQNDYENDTMFFVLFSDMFGIDYGITQIFVFPKSLGVFSICAAFECWEQLPIISFQVFFSFLKNFSMSK